MRDGTRAGRDLLRAMRLAEVVEGEEGEKDGGQGTVRRVGRSG